METEKVIEPAIFFAGILYFLFIEVVLITTALWQGRGTEPVLTLAITAIGQTNRKDIMFIGIAVRCRATVQ
ncbi:hypothetical protein SEEH0752_13701 [Salmonella enterica subsp. enterica serovar Heidelberg str. CVM20752]|nr:hypothetical protein SEEHN189_01729 [Salmonella enterica subsp. enterica serovar Heidelberg str. N189]EYI77385.1 hypothetical protein SEEH0752_13701 [Salmonella enterica subsp. enterica serovar Heidelberg str. CVM20752]